jgi:lipoprotein NlpI
MILAIGAGVIVAALAACAWVQTGYWRNSVTLLDHTIAVTTRNPVAHNNLGIALEERADYEGAVREFSEATRIKPDYAEAHINRASALCFLGRYAEAWQEVKLYRDCGCEPPAQFIQALSQRMPEPPDRAR